MSGMKISIKCSKSLVPAFWKKRATWDVLSPDKWHLGRCKEVCLSTNRLIWHQANLWQQSLRARCSDRFWWLASYHKLWMVNLKNGLGDTYHETWNMASNDKSGTRNTPQSVNTHWLPQWFPALLESLINPHQPFGLWLSGIIGWDGWGYGNCCCCILDLVDFESLEIHPGVSLLMVYFCAHVLAIGWGANSQMVVS